MSPSKKKKPGRASARGGNGKSAPARKRPLAAEIAGVVLLFASLFLLLSLIGYDAHDPSWARAVESGYKVRNIGGRVGAWVAETALQGFGLTAFLFPFVMAFIGIQAVLVGGKRHLVRKAAKFGLGLAILCPLLNLLFQALTWRGTEVEPGGFFGSLIDEGLTGLLNPTGALILLLAAAVLFAVFATGVSLKTVFRAIGRLFASATREVTIKITEPDKPARAAVGKTELLGEADEHEKKGQGRKASKAALPPGEAETAPPRPAPVREVKRGTVQADQVRAATSPSRPSSPSWPRTTTSPC